MKNRIYEAVSEVLLSIAGSIGVILLISWLLAANDATLETGKAFSSYFSGGQAGLTILAVSGAAFGSLLRHPRKDRLISVLLGLALFIPIIATSFIIGTNPGFSNASITGQTIKILWWLFVAIHALWFFFILTGPVSPDLESADAERESRVNSIKPGAASGA